MGVGSQAADAMNCVPTKRVSALRAMFAPLPEFGEGMGVRLFARPLLERRQVVEHMDRRVDGEIEVLDDDVFIRRVDVIARP